jgi:high affinity sulfate transporter 1
MDSGPGRRDRRGGPGRWLGRVVPELGRLVPGVGVLVGYRRSWLRGDLVAGLGVAAYLVPQVMAYAGVAGLPPVTGLWAIVGTLLVYALIGSSRQLSVGPESTTALMTAAAIGPLAAGAPGRYAALAAGLALLVGLVCLVAWTLRMGFLAELLSRPVLIGYLAGVAIIMIIGQLGRVTGVRAAGGTPVGELADFVAHAGRVHWPTLALAAATLVALTVGTRVLPRAPVPLVVVVAAALAVAVLHLRELGLAVIGEVPRGVPVPAWPALSARELFGLAPAALGVTVVAYTDNVLTGRAFARRSEDTPDANQELLALGTANAAAAVLHGFAVSSSGSRTAIADSLGARSQLYSLVTLGTVVVVLVAGGGLLAGFPVAALGALVVWAAAKLIEGREFRRLAGFRRSELVLALATTAGVLVVDILYGVLVAVGLSLLDVLRRVARPHDGVLGYVTGVAGMHDIDDYPQATQVPGLVVYRYDSPLFFANAENFRRRALAAVAGAPQPVEWLLLNAEANVQVDLTSLEALDGLRTELKRRGIVLALARVKVELADDLRRAGVLERIGADRVFPTLPTAVAGYAAWYEHRHGRPPVRLGPDGVPEP